MNKRVKDEEGNTGTITEVYRGPKEGMKGRVKVVWDNFVEWTWEYRCELTELPPILSNLESK